MTVQNNIKQLDLESRDLIEDRVEQLKRLFPEVVTEGSGSVDFEKLRLVLGGEVDENDERYAFTWPGKTDAIRQAQTVSTATLRPCPEKSVDWDTTKNLYIEGDNLEVLKLLQRSYHGKVKMIYVDPPYNTGHDFVYHDTFGDSIENYKEQAGISGQSNADTSGRYHSNWCSMMYPRLKLARELLSDEGVIFISIDDVEVGNLRLICDELFGTNNFVAQMIRASSASQNTAKFVSVMHDYILVYCKNKDANGGGWKTKKNYADEFQRRATLLFKQGLSEEEIASELRALVKYPRFFDFDHYTMCDGKGVFQLVSMGGVEKGNTETVLIHPSTKKPCEMPKGGWRYTDAVIRQMVASDQIYYGGDEKYVPRKKLYLQDYLYQIPKGIMFYDTQSDVKFLQKEHIPFDFPKPKSLIVHLEEMVGLKNDDIILDFFSGSATTADATISFNAVNSTNVKFILVQLPERIQLSSDAAKTSYSNLCELGEGRIRRAGKKITEEVEEANRQLKLDEGPRKVPDIGFRILKLDDSGIAQPESGQLMLNRVKPDRTDEDIIFEMMLKWGIDLTSSIKKLKLRGGVIPAIQLQTANLFAA